MFLFYIIEILEVMLFHETGKEGWMLHTNLEMVFRLRDGIVQSVAFFICYDLKSQYFSCKYSNCTLIDICQKESAYCLVFIMPIKR
jgi:hypothetical protein